MGKKTQKRIIAEMNHSAKFGRFIAVATLVIALTIAALLILVIV